jgi:hypothetical protein
MNEKVGQCDVIEKETQPKREREWMKLRVLTLVLPED